MRQYKNVHQLGSKKILLGKRRGGIERGPPFQVRPIRNSRFRSPWLVTLEHEITPGNEKIHKKCEISRIRAF